MCLGLKSWGQAGANDKGKDLIEYIDEPSAHRFSDTIVFSLLSGEFVRHYENREHEKPNQTAANAQLNSICDDISIVKVGDRDY